MKILSCILSLLFLTEGVAQTEYALYPNGFFGLTSTNFGPYDITSTDFENFEIYKITESGYSLWGTIEKPFGCTRSYILAEGNENLATHVASLLSLGSISDYFKQYTIYDDQGRFIGSIQGEPFNENSPKFSLCNYRGTEFLFFDEQNELLAKAVIDSTYSKLTITSPEGKPLITGSKSFTYQPNFSSWGQPTNIVYFWKIREIAEESTDMRFFWPFIAFISEVWWEQTT